MASPVVVFWEVSLKRCTLIFIHIDSIKITLKFLQVKGQHI